MGTDFRRRVVARLSRAAAVLMATVLLAGLAASARAQAEEAAGESETDLAKQTQNPVADLISIPLQNNFNFGAGTDDDLIWILNVQPVVPFELSDDWNLITRTIIPVINQPALFPGSDSAFGMGDINPSFFFSPANSGKFIWGAGPSFTFPTATSSELGSGKYSLGPSAVGLYMDGPWVVGLLATHQWSYAGWGDRDVNLVLFQPFVNYNLPDGWYVTSVPIITGDFSADGGNHWTVPIGAGAGKLWRLGQIGLPLNTQILQRGDSRFRAGLAASVPAAVSLPALAEARRSRRAEGSGLRGGAPYPPQRPANAATTGAKASSAGSETVT